MRKRLSERPEEPGAGTVERAELVGDAEALEADIVLGAGAHLDTIWNQRGLGSILKLMKVLAQ